MFFQQEKQLSPGLENLLLTKSKLLWTTYTWDAKRSNINFAIILMNDLFRPASPGKEWNMTTLPLLFRVSAGMAITNL